jgi:leader peptidase (prepilin peptidase) / N-methyltransferase
MMRVAFDPQFFWSFVVVIAVSVPVVILDVRERRIPDVFVLPAIAAAIGVRLIAGHPVAQIALHLAIGAATFALVVVITRGRLGWGDVKYSALIAVAVGYWGWMVAMLAACLAAAAWFAGLALRGQRGVAIPFGPFMAGGTLVGGAAVLLLPVDSIVRLL